MKKALLAVSAASFLLLQACGGGGGDSASANPTPASPTPTSNTPADPTPANNTPANPAPANGTLAASPLARNTSVSVSDADAAALRQGNTTFAIDLYKTLRKDASFTNKNIFFSPHSISVALAMTYAGARGATANELKNTMHFTLPGDRLHPAFDALDLALMSPRQPAADGSAPLTLSVANSMWGEATTTFEQPFLDTLATNYGAGVYRANFKNAPDAARITINDWVANKTNDKIRDLLPQKLINELTRLVLVNAVYFNGDWVTPFSSNATIDGTFHGTTGDTTVKMMRKTADFAYGQGSGWRAINLPYYGGAVFTAILPDNLETFEASFNPAVLADIDSALSSKSAGNSIPAGALLASDSLVLSIPPQVELTLPKFKIEDGTFSIKDALKALGTTTLFTLNADLTGISTNKNEPLHVGEVVHKAFISVDEKGTEAAAATAVISCSYPQMCTTGTEVRPPPVVLTLDKPFVFLIRDTATGAILFLGRYVGG